MAPKPAAVGLLLVTLALYVSAGCSIRSLPLKDDGEASGEAENGHCTPTQVRALGSYQRCTAEQTPTLLRDVASRSIKHSTTDPCHPFELSDGVETCM